MLRLRSSRLSGTSVGSQAEEKDTLDKRDKRPSVEFVASWSNPQDVSLHDMHRNLGLNVNGWRSLNQAEVLSHADIMNEMQFIKDYIREQRRIEQARDTARQRREEELEGKFAAMTDMLGRLVQAIDELKADRHTHMGQTRQPLPQSDRSREEGTLLPCSNAPGRKWNGNGEKKMSPLRKLPPPQTYLSMTQRGEPLPPGNSGLWY
jgi:hypothetical protein